MPETNLDMNSELTDDIQAINLPDVIQQLTQARAYVEETRADFENGGPVKWVSDTAAAVNNAYDTFSQLDLDFAGELQEWTDEEGNTQQLLVRVQAEDRFEEAVQQYHAADELFGNYLNKHIELIKKQTGVK